VISSEEFNQKYMKPIKDIFDSAQKVLQKSFSSGSKEDNFKPTKFAEPYLRKNPTEEELGQEILEEYLRMVNPEIYAQLVEKEAFEMGDQSSGFVPSRRRFAPGEGLPEPVNESLFEIASEGAPSSIPEQIGGIRNRPLTRIASNSLASVPRGLDRSAVPKSLPRVRAQGLRGMRTGSYRVKGNTRLGPLGLGRLV